jgi:hypothetical protein
MSRTRQILMTIFFSVLAVASTHHPVFANGRGARAVEGVWAMTITLRDCATGAPLGPPVRTLLTFHAGGTLSESPGTTQFAPGQRSPGHGTWSRAGRHAVALRFAAMILFDTPPAPPAPGFQAGWLMVASKFVLTDADHADVTATVQFLDLNRNEYRAACPTGTAERFQ